MTKRGSALVVRCVLADDRRCSDAHLEWWEAPYSRTDALDVYSTTSTLSMTCNKVDNFLQAKLPAAAGRRLQLLCYTSTHLANRHVLYSSYNC